MSPPNSPCERLVGEMPLDPTLAELEGYKRSGMQKEALRLARRLLRRPKITGAQFDAAMETLVLMEPRHKRRRELVEQAYAHLSVKAKRSVRYRMLRFYHMAGDNIAASGYLPKNFYGPRGLIELTVAWDIWAGLGDEQALAEHFEIVANTAEGLKCPFMRPALFASLGDYCLHRAWWRRAVECYREIPAGSYYAYRAVLGPLLALSDELLAACSDAYDTLDQFRAYQNPDEEATGSGNYRRQFQQAERELEQFRRGLRYAIGKKQLKFTGLSKL